MEKQKTQAESCLSPTSSGTIQSAASKDHGCKRMLLRAMRLRLGPFRAVLRSVSVVTAVQRAPYGKQAQSLRSKPTGVATVATTVPVGRKSRLVAGAVSSRYRGDRKVCCMELPRCCGASSSSARRESSRFERLQVCAIGAGEVGRDTLISHTGQRACDAADRILRQP